jgi:hypothetical protein
VVKKFRVYLFYIGILIFMFLIGVAVKQINFLRDIETQTADASHYYVYIILMFIIYAMCGALFGVESFLKEKGNKGKWSLKIPKIIILGVPSAIMGMYYFFYYVLRIPIPLQFGLVFCDFSAITIIMQILFGYTVITSLYKKDIQKSQP